MINRRSRHIKECEINVIPFLDILLVLLLIFMISTTSTITQNFEVCLPRSSYLQSVNKSHPLKITIEVLGNERYNMFINHKKIENISSDHILSEIHSKKNNIQLSNTIFLIAAPYNITYNEVIKTLNFLYKIGVSSVNMLTSPI